MTLTERIFALKSVTPFDQLRESELTLIAQGVRVKSYAPGEAICTPDKPLRRLHVVAQGDVHNGDNVVFPVFGIQTLLYNRLNDITLTAGSEGVTCLLIKKGAFYTIISECPGLLIGFLQLSEKSALI